MEGRRKEAASFVLPPWKLAQGESQDFPRPAATVAVARTTWDRHVTLFYNCLCYANGYTWEDGLVCGHIMTLKLCMKARLRTLAHHTFLPSVLFKFYKSYKTSQPSNQILF